MNTNRISVIQFNWAAILAILVAVMAAWVSVFYATQPLLEQHGFRQTQTAITSYWMIQDGWRLAYETPVGGYPWILPFEFPIYQSLVALISYSFHSPLDATGRLLSFCFLLACAWPAWAITQRLKLKTQVAWVFCALLWSSPIYLFWGRTFMIETTAVFFTLAAIPYAIDLFESSPRWISAILFAIFLTLGMLQKVTTIAPVMVVLAVIILIVHLKSFGFKLPAWRKSACLAIAFLLPLVILTLWTSYSDYLKLQYSFGAYLTSKGLSGWTYGTLKQRLDVDALKEVFWNRVILHNVAGILGIAILCVSLFFAEARIRTIILISLVMFVLPVFIFTNLQVVHNYYQVSITLFLIGALAIAIVHMLPNRFEKFQITPFITIALVVCNLYNFNTGYGNDMRRTFDVSQTGTLAIGDVIQRYSPKESGIVVFGADWSSEIAYYSKRKSFTVPLWFKEYNSVWKSPANYIGDLKLGAVVFIVGDGDINLTSILAQPDVHSDSCLFKINSNSYIWLPGVKSISPPTTQVSPGLYSRCIQ